MRCALLLMLLAGCSEYKLKDRDTGPDGNPDDSGDTDTEDTADSDVDCEDEVFPGYAGSDDACPSSSDPFTPIVEWHYDEFSVDPDWKSIMMTPIVVPLDDSGLPAVVFVRYAADGFSGTGILTALYGDGSGEVFNNTTAGLQACSGLAAGDLDGDGSVEIVGITLYGEVRAFDAAGDELWTSIPVGEHLGENAPNPAIADMDADGSPEIVVGRVILEADGDIRGAGGSGKGAGMYYGVSSFPADIDRDGVMEVVTGNALYEPNGSQIWFNGRHDGHVAVGNFDGDEEGEIVVVIDTKVRLQDDDGSLIWEEAIPGSAYVDFGGPPTIADFDGDGEPEIGVAANSTYSVFEGDGTLLWQKSTVDGSSGVTGSAVFDFEGDGVAEVVYADEETVWVFNGPDGAVKMEETDHSSWTILEYPVIVDVDADDNAEIVVAHNLHPWQSRPQVYGITVYGDFYEAWMPGRRIWNQHAYSITNVEDDGGIPVAAEVNWDTYNSFRSGDLVAGGANPHADPTIAEAGLCDLDCDEGLVTVWVHPGNVGSVDASEATVSIWRVQGDTETLVDSELVDVLPSGEFADSLQFTIAGSVDDLDAIVARVSVEGGQCDTDNDEVRWDGPFCPD